MSGYRNGTGRARCGASTERMRPRSCSASLTRPKSSISRYRSPPWMSLEERDDVPAAQSFASTMPTLSPRVTASSAAPAPTMPPPTIRMSSSWPGAVLPLSTVIEASRSAGPRAPPATGEPPGKLFMSRLHPGSNLVGHQTTSKFPGWAGPIEPPVVGVSCRRKARRRRRRAGIPSGPNSRWSPSNGAGHRSGWTSRWCGGPVRRGLPRGVRQCPR